jgi:hypothetical protein
VTGAGIDSLLRRISTILVPQVPRDDQLIPFTPRQVLCLQRALHLAESRASARHGPPT